MNAGVQRATKRALDATIAAVLVAGFLPLLACAGIAVLVGDGRPLLFVQRRSGKDGLEFNVRKFRTMRLHDALPEELGQVRDDHELVTRTGRLLRRLKIDELPQLLNVLSGDMSLVGPRPTLPSQVSSYDRFQLRRLEVRPGLTGWAQVNGNATLTWPERIALDVWYVDHWSLGLDLKIMGRTVGVILRGERPDASAISEARKHEDSARRRGGEHQGRT